jgi:hypothetical protein
MERMDGTVHRLGHGKEYQVTQGVLVVKSIMFTLIVARTGFWKAL